MRARALAGLRRYQDAVRQPNPDPPREVARVGRASLVTHMLRDAAVDGAAPVLLVPSLINPPSVLDITPNRSLLRFLLRENHDAYLVDWGHPQADERGLDLAGHVEQLLIPLIDTLPRPPILVGYCLGGTLAIGAAARMAALGRPAAGVATIAAPWDFAQYDAAFTDQVASVWRQSRPGCEALGLVPMEVLQSGFWSLDPQRTIAKYADFGALEADTPAYRGFIALEDWANDGAPLTLGTGCDLFDNCYGANRTGSGDWTISGTAVDPAALSCPTLAVISTNDRIVPASTAPPAQERLELALGHVGMMIGGRAERSLWQPLSDWLSRIGR